MLLLFGFSALYFIVCSLFGLQKNNYDISFAFYIGCSFSFYKNEIITFLSNKYRIVILILILSFLITFSIGAIGGGYPPIYILY